MDCLDITEVYDYDLDSEFLDEVVDLIESDELKITEYALNRLSEFLNC